MSVRHTPTSVKDLSEQKRQIPLIKLQVAGLETENLDLTLMLLDTDYRLLLLENGITDLQF